MTGKLPIHPEAVPGDPQAVRWVVPTGGVPVGEVRGAPGSFGSMLELPPMHTPCAREL